MEELIKYLEDNFIKYKVIAENVVEIGGKTYGLAVARQQDIIDENGVIKPGKAEKLFMRNFQFIGELLTDVSVDNYVYKFGSQWYWLPVGKEKEVTLTKLRYIGETTYSGSEDSFLGVHGSFELMNGSGHYGEWVDKAKFLGIKNLGLCERDTLAGALKFQLACQKGGIHPIIGMEVTVYRPKEDLSYTVKCFVENEKGWDNLLGINKEINCENGRYVEEDKFFDLTDGLVVVFDPKTLDFNKVPLLVGYYQLDTVEYTKVDRDNWYLTNLREYIYSKLKPVAICDAYYLEADYSIIKQRLNSIAGKSTYESHNQYFKNWDEYLIELTALCKNNEDGDSIAAELFDVAIENLHDIVKRCKFTIPVKNRHLPAYKMKPEEAKQFSNSKDLFWHLIEKGIENHPEFIDKYGEDAVIERIQKEVDTIEYGETIDYFLILWDIVGWCRKEGILTGLGRGSAGGSLIAALLDITRLDPIGFDLLFERFLNKGRIQVSLPDIDTDFPGEDRARVKEYMEQRYGITQVCSVGTYSALQPRQAIKDFARLMGIPFQDVNMVTKILETSDRKYEDIFIKACGNGRLMTFIHKYPELINEISIILGAPKTQSIHACATMIFPDEHDMFHWVPIRKQEGMYVSEWEGNEMDSAGFLKEDILGVKQLDKFQNILKLIKENHGVGVDIYNLPLDDKEVYRYFKNGWNGDVFHFGSSGLTSYCKEMQPDNIEDLVVAISLYRPGAMENNFHNEYIARKRGEKPVEYFVGTEPILKNTLGIFCYQEQIMRLCQDLGGLSLVEADDVRKAMVKKKYEELTKYRERFIPYYVENFKVDLEYAEHVWDAIDKASTYLFNRSHAVAYTLTGYISQWLKVHYPLEYWTVAFSYASDEDYAVYIQEINALGNTEIVPPDVNKSEKYVSSDVKTNKMYWSLLNIKQVGDRAADQIFNERIENGEYFSLADFADRNLSYKENKVNKRVIENIIMAGGFDVVEKVQKPHERMKLITDYREMVRQKVNEEKDIFVNNPKTAFDWWWLLQQKALTGFAIFDYKELINKYLVPKVTGEYPIIDFDKANSPDFYNGRNTLMLAGGIVHDISIRNSARGNFARLVLEQNYKFLKVTIFSQFYEELESYFANVKGNILLMNGSMAYDNYNKEPYLQTRTDSKFVILT